MYFGKEKNRLGSVPWLGGRDVAGLDTQVWRRGEMRWQGSTQSLVDEKVMWQGLARRLKRGDTARLGTQVE